MYWTFLLESIASAQRSVPSVARKIPLLAARVRFGTAWPVAQDVPL
jgi:hypothetical protein